MTDLSKTIAPKSDQLNADDLIGRTMTIKVTGVSKMKEPEQPIAISFEGDNGKPYKPGKSMRRVLVNAWGADGNAYVGRRMTLYRDDKVQFGGEQVGGIRISHLSDIRSAITMALTATRASRKPFTVKPLPQDANAPNASAAAVDPVDVDRLKTMGEEASDRGTETLRTFWAGISLAMKTAIGGTAQLEKWKTRAAEIDAADFGGDPIDGRFDEGQYEGAAP